MPRPTHNETTYLPGLDGIRAIAVTVVLLYHLQVPGFSGGLLGVGVFFTLSGFLITSLLISARERTGGLGLKTFWIRRARRLLPAVVLVLIATLATTAVVVPDKLGKYAGEALSALFYVNNWHTIASDTSYFERFGGPSPLSHMWSLSIEEQFYIAWPLLLAGLYLVLRKRWIITLAVLGLALGSFYLLSTLAEAGFDNTRAYEGTDTRAGALLLGAALAFWWPARVHRVTHNQRTFVDVLGLAGLATVFVLCVTVPDGSMELYRWGIAVLTVATMGVLIAAVTPSTLVATLLGMQPLRWIGERSYGIYLWHMPLVAFLPGLIRGGSPLVSSLVVIVATCVIASLSWRYVEDPIRRYGFRKALTTPRPAEDTLRAALLTTLISFFTGIARLLDALRRRITGERPAPTGDPRDDVPVETGTALDAPDVDAAPGDTAEPPAAAVDTTVPAAPAVPVQSTAWDAAAPRALEPPPLHEETIDLFPSAPVVEETVDLDASEPAESAADDPDATPVPGGAAEPSAAETRRFKIPTEITVLSTAPSVLNLTPADDADETPTARTAVPAPTARTATTPDVIDAITGAATADPVDLETASVRTALRSGAPVRDVPRDPAGPDDAPAARRSPVRAALVSLSVLVLAIGAMIGVSRLDPDMPIVNALYHPESGGSGIDDEAADDGPKPERYGPTLPENQRRTKCSTVIHVGDSTSIGMNDASMQPNPALRLIGQYQRVGAKRYVPDVVGGRSSMERLNGEPNATESIDSALARGVRGCWVVAMGINDTANVEVGGQGPVDMRIDNLLKPLAGQPVLWPTIITNHLNENPAYDNKAMQNFNRALVRACKRYPNLRVYDWAGEVDQAWFLDGVHYTEAGYIERARRFAVALATEFPASDLPPAGCVLKSTSAVEAQK